VPTIINHSRGLLFSALIVVTASGIISGCSALTPGLESWQGHTADQLIASWGQPDSSVDLGIDMIAYSWLSQNGDCEQTFTARDNKIIGVSDSGCTG
jgi:hypothetical protein